MQRFYKPTTPPASQADVITGQVSKELATQATEDTTVDIEKSVASNIQVAPQNSGTPCYSENIRKMFSR